MRTVIIRICGTGQGSGMRAVCVILHRYIGLGTALFLVLLGITGSVITWREPLSAWFAPELYHPQGRGAVLTPDQLIEHVHSADSRAAVVFFPLSLEEGKGARIYVAARPELKQPLEYDQLWLDPVTGTELGRTNSESAWPTRQSFIDWCYHLHRQLAIPGRWGVWILGIVSLLWFFDCFVGAYLTFPRTHVSLGRWWPAWKVRQSRLNYDLHRAGGLWPWALLAVMALSGVYFNLNESVFMPVLRSVATVTTNPFDWPPVTDTTPTQVTLSQAAATAGEKARELQWPAAAEGAYHDVQRRFWFIYFEKSPSAWATAGSYGVFVDDRNGSIVATRTPRGTAGDVFINWLADLHMGEVFGIPYKIVLTVLGLVVAVLSATGVIIWWRKLSSRRAMHRRKEAAAEASPLTSPVRPAPEPDQSLA